MIYLTIFAVLMLLLAARKARPGHDRTGQGLTAAPQLNDVAKQSAGVKTETVPEVLKVATYNVQTGKNLANKRDISASAQVMAAADIVGVQEVYAPTFLNLLGVGDSQTQALARIGGFGWLFAATRRRYLKDHRGNALLSKLPVRRWEIKMLPDRSGKSYRNLTVAHVEWQGHAFHFLNTHLHTKVGRREQVDVVLREFARYSPAILVGDFNCTATELNDALRDIDIVDAVAKAQLDLSGNRIDWILTKGFDVVGGNFVDKGVSDHPYYQVNLQFTPSS